MARPIKSTLHYFPLDVDFFDDDKILSIEEECGITGGYIAIRIMAMVYKTNGYFLEWPENYEYRVAKRVGNGVTSSLVVDVFNSCLKNGLFDKAIFDKHGVLTSAGIQKRWLRVMTDLRRKVVVNVSIWLITYEETTTNETESTQKEKREKEIKLNEKKGEVNNSPANSFLEKGLVESEKGMPAGNFTPPDFKDVGDYFFQSLKNAFDGSKCNLIAQKFYNHYKGLGWKTNNGVQIVDWKAIANKWMLGDLEAARTAKQFNGKSAAIAVNGKQQDEAKLKAFTNSVYNEFKEGTTIEPGIPADLYDFLKEKEKIELTPDMIVNILQQCDGNGGLAKKKSVAMYFTELVEAGETSVF